MNCGALDKALVKFFPYSCKNAVLPAGVALLNVLKVTPLTFVVWNTSLAISPIILFLPNFSTIGLKPACNNNFSVKYTAPTVVANNPNLSPGFIFISFAISFIDAPACKLPNANAAAGLLVIAAIVA